MTLKYIYKQLIFDSARPFLAVNAFVFKLFRLRSTLLTNNKVRLHLGSGTRYIEGWLNIDANILKGKCDLSLDLRNRLPFPRNTIDAIYSHHVIEHLPDMRKHLTDAYRVLKPNGVYRVAGPNGDSAIQKFCQGDKTWFGDWPVKYESIGGRFSNFILCGNDHLGILTSSLMEEIGHLAGFKNVVIKLPVKETSYPQLFEDILEYERERDYEFPHTLVMEFQK